MPLLRFIPEATNINFVGARYIAFTIDGLLLLVSIVSIVWHGFNLGIDFTGGVLQPERAHLLRPGSDERNASMFASFGEIGILAQKTIARMDSIGSGLASGIQHLGDV